MFVTSSDFILDAFLVKQLLFSRLQIERQADRRKDLDIGTNANTKISLCNRPIQKPLLKAFDYVSSKLFKIRIFDTKHFQPYLRKQNLDHLKEN